MAMGKRFDLGREGLPNASEMDRPMEKQGTFKRTGDGKMSIDRGSRTIQDQDKGRRDDNC